MSVSVVIERRVAEVYIDHPPVNAPDSGGWDRIADTITSLGDSDDVQCIILAAKGRGFCAGVDIKELAADSTVITKVNAGCWRAFAAICRPTIHPSVRCSSAATSPGDRSSCMAWLRNITASLRPNRRSEAPISVSI